MSVAFCCLRVVSRWLARVILPELILDRSAVKDRIESAPQVTAHYGSAQWVGEAVREAPHTSRLC